MWVADKPTALNPMNDSTTKQLHLITRRQLASRWSSSIGTIKRRERAGLLPVVTLGGNRARYRLSDVEAYEALTTISKGNSVAPRPTNRRAI